MARFARVFFTGIRYLLLGCGLVWLATADRSPPFEAASFEIPSRYAFLYDWGFDGPSVEEIRSELRIDRIVLQRTPCFGSCPDYEVSMSRSGLATYEGGRRAERRGSYGGEVDVGTFAMLSFAFERVGFDRLEPKYTANWTDDSTVILTVVLRDGREIQVSDYGRQAPPEFWLLTTTVDAIADRIEWERAIRRQG